MDSTVRISVALGTHNGGRFIGDQIASILEQSRPVDEIVLSDDASADRTVTIVEEAVAAYASTGGRTPKLTVLRNDPPLRVTKNFEQALLATTGGLVALCDQDDVWHPGRIAELAEVFADPEALLVFSNARQVNADLEYLGHDLFDAIGMSSAERELLENGQAFRVFLRRNLATGATVMLRRSLVDQAAPFPDSWLHDEWLAMLAAAQDGARILDRVLTDYRQHGNNQVGMERLGFARKLRLFAEPRAERNLRLYRRARAIAPALDDLEGVPGRYRAAAREKFAFEEVRQAYPAARLLRLAPIVQQLRLGRYSRYGTGFKDAIRNLLQPI